MRSQSQTNICHHHGSDKKGRLNYLRKKHIIFFWAPFYYHQNPISTRPLAYPEHFPLILLDTFQFFRLEIRRHDIVHIMVSCCRLGEESAQITMVFFTIQFIIIIIGCQIKKTIE